MWRFKVQITDPQQRTKTLFVECDAGNARAAREMIADLLFGKVSEQDRITIRLVKEEKETT